MISIKFTYKFMDKQESVLCIFFNVSMPMSSSHKESHLSHLFLKPNGGGGFIVPAFFSNGYFFMKKWAGGPKFHDFS